MIIFDTETTSLCKPSATELHLQPSIIEFYALKFDADYNIIDEFETFLKPPIPVSDEITKITGIQNSDLINAPRFIQIYDQLCDFFLGEEYLIAHNLTFDRNLLSFELRRIDKLLNFPWPKNHICTVESSFPIENKRLKLQQLYKIATGREFVDGHRAKMDVMALFECVKFLREKGFI